MLWIVTVIDGDNVQYMAFDEEEKARSCYRHWLDEGYEASLRPYKADDGGFWEKQSREVMERYENLQGDYNELKLDAIRLEEELAKAKERFDEVTTELHNEVEPLRQDINILKEALVRQALKAVGLWN